MNIKLIVIAVVAILVASGAGIAYMVLDGDKGSNITIDVNLEIFGNADKDSKIDNADANMVRDYVNAVNNGDNDKVAEIAKSMSMDFADANRDGRIDSADVDLIRAIAAGTAKDIWILDGLENIRKVSRNIDKIGCEYYTNTELCLILGLGDKITAVDNAPYLYKDFYFTSKQQGNITNMINCSSPDYDFINSLDLDIYLLFAPTASYEAKQEKIIDCDVLYLGLYNPDLTNTSKSSFIQGVLKAGYIFGEVDRAEKYVEWILDYRDMLLDIAESIPEKDKPVVGMSNYTSTQYFCNENNTTMSLYRYVDPLGQAAYLAGGHNIVDDLVNDNFITSSAAAVSVGVDAVMNDDPNINVDYYFLHMVKYTYSATINAGVPDHGYIEDDRTEIEAAQKNAMSRNLLEDEQVYLLAGDFRNGASGGILLGAYMGKIMNPEKYSSVDPVKMHNEYVEWMGIKNYDVAENGVFLSPNI